MALPDLSQLINQPDYPILFQRIRAHNKLPFSLETQLFKQLKLTYSLLTKDSYTSHTYYDISSHGTHTFSETYIKDVLKNKSLASFICNTIANDYYTPWYIDNTSSNKTNKIAIHIIKATKQQIEYAKQCWALQPNPEILNPNFMYNSIRHSILALHRTEYDIHGIYSKTQPNEPESQEKTTKVESFFILTNHISETFMTKVLLFILSKIIVDNNIEISQTLESNINKMIQLVSSSSTSVEDSETYSNLIDISTKILEELQSVLDEIIQNYQLQKYVNVILNNRATAIIRLQSEYNNTITKINDYANAIHTANDSLITISNNIQDLKNINITNSSDILKPFKENKSIIKIEPYNERFYITIRTLLNNIDYDMVEKSYHRCKQARVPWFSYIDDYLTKKLIKALFVDQSYSLYVEQTFELTFSQYLKISVSPCRLNHDHVRLPYSSSYESHLTTTKKLLNPHLSRYACFGNTTTELTKHNDLADLEYLLNLLTLSTANLNFQDSTVTTLFMETLKYTVLHTDEKDRNKIVLRDNINNKDVTLQEVLNNVSNMPIGDVIWN